MFQVIDPASAQALDQYYQFRWTMLRKPWGEPEGSEKDEYDSHGIHRMVCDDNNQPIGIGRLHVTSADEGQIRYMAVDKAYRGQNIGTLLMMSLEEEARKQGLKRLILNSREDSSEFYIKCGYRVTGEAPTLLGSVNLQQLKKTLSEVDVIIRDAQWCKELQQTWYDEIPISQVMGIKVHQYTGRVFETRAALNPNLNLHGTMFAGSVFSLASLTGWGLLYLWCKDQEVEGHIVLGDGQIHYHKPVTQQPGALARMADIEGDLSPLAQGKKARLKLTVEVKDGDKAVAEFKGVYVILPKTPGES
ncbi:MAG: thioesterase domain-containing protein [Phenylobacterium sp.]|jgi:thioesterase domain-containing protein